MNKSLRYWVQQTYHPTVMVICSDEVNSIMSKNNLSFVDVLRPLGIQLESIGTVTFRSAVQEVQLQNFGINFVDSRDVVGTDFKYADEILNENFKLNNFERIDGIETIKDIPWFFKQYPDPSDWYTKYREDFLETLKFHSTEFVDQPIACIIAVSSTEKNVVGTLDSLSRINYLPMLFQEKFYDPKILKTYVLIHDNHEIDVDFRNNFKKMQMVYNPKHCSILRINSIPLNEPNMNRNEVFSRYFTLKRKVDLQKTEQKNFGFGRYLSIEDMKQISEFVKDYTLKVFIPFIEQKVQSLFNVVSASRKGFSNRIKYLFGRRDPKTVMSRGIYNLDSVESNIRLLADLAFVMQDYKLALDNYNLVISDYKADKAWLLFGGSSEMVGLCYALLGMGANDPIKYFDVAYKKYLDHKDGRRATRVCMWCADVLFQDNKKKDAAMWMIKAADREDTIRNALLHERAAYIYLSIGMIRKYSFNMVMASISYSKKKFDESSLRCDSCAHCVIASKNWVNAEEHLNQQLGRSNFKLERYDDAINDAKNLLASENIWEDANNPLSVPLNMRFSLKTSKELEEARIKEFLLFIQGWAKSKGATDILQYVPDIRIPSIDNSSIDVNLNTVPPTANDLRLQGEPHRKFGNSVPNAYTRNVWRKSFASKPSLTKTVSSLLPTNNVEMESLFLDSDRFSFVNEEIFVEFRAFNPLQTELKVKNMKLICRYETAEKEEVKKNDDDKNNNNNGNNNYQISPLDIVIPPRSIKKIVLSIKCFKEGRLLIENVEWELFNAVKTSHRLVLPPRRILNSIKNATKIIEAPNHSLSIPIKWLAPHLQISLISSSHHTNGLPNHLFKGECIICYLNVENVGDVAVNKLSVKISHPALCGLGSPFRMKIDSKFSSNLRAFNGKNSSSGCCTAVMFCDVQTGLVELDKKDLLGGVEPNESLLFPVYLRANQSQKLNLELLLKYDSDAKEAAALAKVPSSSLKTRSKIPLTFRLCHIKHEIFIHELLSASTFQGSSSTDVYKTVFGLILENVLPKVPVCPVNIQQITFSSIGWDISPLPRQQENKEKEDSAQDSEENKCIKVVNAESCCFLFNANDSTHVNKDLNKKGTSTNLLAFKGTLYGKPSNVFNSENSFPVLDENLIPYTDFDESKPIDQLKEPVLDPGMGFGIGYGDIYSIKHDYGLIESQSDIETEKDLEVKKIAKNYPLSRMLVEEKRMMRQDMYARRLERHKRGDSSRDPEEIDERLALTIMVSWVIHNSNSSSKNGNSNQPPRFGILHMPSLDILNRSSEEIKCPFKFVMEYPPQLEAAFHRHIEIKEKFNSDVDAKFNIDGDVKNEKIKNKGGQKVIEIPESAEASVLIRFRSVNKSVPFKLLFETMSPYEEYDEMSKDFVLEKHNSLESRYLWSGETVKTFEEVKPNDVIEIKLKGHFFSPGLYNLNRFKFLITEISPTGELKPTRLFYFPSDNLIMVHNKDIENVSNSKNKLIEDYIHNQEIVEHDHSLESQEGKQYDISLDLEEERKETNVIKESVDRTTTMNGSRDNDSDNGNNNDNYNNNEDENSVDSSMRSLNDTRQTLALDDSMDISSSFNLGGKQSDLSAFNADRSLVIKEEEEEEGTGNGNDIFEQRRSISDDPDNGRSSRIENVLMFLDEECNKSEKEEDENFMDFSNVDDDEDEEGGGRKAESVPKREYNITPVVDYEERGLMDNDNEEFDLNRPISMPLSPDPEPNDDSSMFKAKMGSDIDNDVDADGQRKFKVELRPAEDDSFKYEETKVLAAERAKMNLNDNENENNNKANRENLSSSNNTQQDDERKSLEEVSSLSEFEEYDDDIVHNAKKESQKEKINEKDEEKPEAKDVLTKSIDNENFSNDIHNNNNNNNNSEPVEGSKEGDSTKLMEPKPKQQQNATIFDSTDPTEAILIDDPDSNSVSPILTFDPLSAVKEEVPILILASNKVEDASKHSISRNKPSLSRRRNSMEKNKELGKKSNVTEGNSESKKKKPIQDEKGISRKVKEVVIESEDISSLSEIEDDSDDHTKKTKSNPRKKRVSRKRTTADKYKQKSDIEVQDVDV